MRSTDASCTVTAAVPVLPPALAEIVTFPGATPVTTPAADTVAIEVLLDDQVKVTPGMVLPFELRAVAVRFVVHATFTFDIDGETVIVEIGGCTVTVADPLFPSLVAVMTADPAATPVTNPDDETVATVPAEVLQVVTRPVRGCPVALMGVAVSWTVWPTVTLGAVGLTTTLATGTTFTVSVADACRPSTVRTTTPVPGDNAVTSPPELTLVKAGVLLDQLTLRPVSDKDCPAAFRAITLS
jgi:hypothetical protein